VTIHDDDELEGDEQFSLHLTDVTEGAKIGPTSMAIVTVLDDDANKTSPLLSYPGADGLAKISTAGKMNNVTIHTRSFWNIRQTIGGDNFLLMIENDQDMQVSCTCVCKCVCVCERERERESE